MTECSQYAIRRMRNSDHSGLHKIAAGTLHLPNGEDVNIHLWLNEEMQQQFCEEIGFIHHENGLK